MKKLIAILLCTLMLLASAACAKTPATASPADPDESKTAAEPETKPEAEAQPETEAQPESEAEAKADHSDDTAMPEIDITNDPVGAWANAQDPELTEEQKAIFEKALSELLGVNYVPIACLGTQLVAGTNYCFLAQATVVYPDAKPTYVLVYVYADLEGGATLMNIADMPVIPNEYGTAEPIPAEETMMGGWSYAESFEITDEIRAKLEKAVDGLVGAEYEPIANLGTQVVAGLNRCLLCKITPVVPNAVAHYALVYVYEDLQGGAELSGTIDLDVGELCTYGA